MRAAELTERVTAWDSTDWVLAVMHYPTDYVLLDRVARKQEIFLRPGPESVIQKEAARAGKTTGTVLAVLYCLSASPWHISDPGLTKAVDVAGKLAELDEADKPRGAPRKDRRPTSHTKIEECYNAMRPVAHLWAAVRLHWEYSTGSSHQKLMRTQKGIGLLLRIARGVQDWALNWEPSRTNSRLQPLALLGDEPWRIPDDISPSAPPWTQHRPDWLIETANAYRRRPR